MEIVTRLEARGAGLNKYFTGVPCKNGHLDGRYVQSGACVSCLKAAAKGFSFDDDPEVVEANAALLAAQQRLAQAKKNAAARRKAIEREAHQEKVAAIVASRAVQPLVDKRGSLAHLQIIKLRGFMEDRGTILGAAAGFAAMRFPVLSTADIIARQSPTDVGVDGTGLHHVYAHPDDFDALRKLANHLINAHPIDLTALRRTAANLQSVQVDDSNTPPDHWK